MSYLPCQNPNCKSYGKPHPNCKCHGGLAEGGDVAHFCSAEKAHEKDCQYFAEGTPEEPISSEPAPLPSPTDAAPTPEYSWDKSEELPAPNGGKASKEAKYSWDDSVGDYETAGQKVLTGIEGLGQGLAGPLATGAELLLSKAGVPGLSSEDIKARQEANPGLHTGAQAAGLVSSFTPILAPIGLVGKAAKVLSVARVAEEASLAAKAGAAALNGLIQGGVLQGSDEISNAMLGKGDPELPVSAKLVGAGKNILISGIGGGVLGAAGTGASKLMSSASETKLGNMLHSYLAGVGEAAKGIAPESSAVRALNPSIYDKGVKLFNKSPLGAALTIGTSAKAVGDTIEGIREGHDLEDIALKVGKDLSIGFGAKAASAVGSRALLKAISSGESPRAIFEVLDHASEVAKGAQKISRGVESLFGKGPGLGAQKELFSSETLKKHREKLNSFLEEGGENQRMQNTIYDQNQAEPTQGFAKGGHVEKSKPTTDGVGTVHTNEAVANIYPDQNILLAAARGRMSNYLNGLRPQKNQPKLAFDDEPDSKQQTKTYHRALDIANEPLSVLDKIKKGTIEPEHIKHFKSLYPELDGALQKQIADQITKAQLKGQKPSRAVRQSLSMFLGTPLSGELSPGSIQAAQATFQARRAQQPPAQTKTSVLKTADDSYLTRDQASASRQQKQ